VWLDFKIKFLKVTTAKDSVKPLYMTLKIVLRYFLLWLWLIVLWVSGISVKLSMVLLGVNFLRVCSKGCLM